VRSGRLLVIEHRLLSAGLGQVSQRDLAAADAGFNARAVSLRTDLSILARTVPALLGKNHGQSGPVVRSRSVS
jgi:hypothetical protein